VFGLELMSSSLPADVTSTQTMIDEYQKLWEDITLRLEKLKQSLIKPKKVGEFIY
jgi:hypothetical protein